MNTLSKEKRQIEVDNEKLIENIEIKLAQLRNQRKAFEEGGYQTVQPQQKIIFKQKSPLSAKPTMLNPSKQIKTTKQNNGKLTHQDYMRQKVNQNEAKQKLSQLQQLYNKKKQLQAIGVIPVSINQVQSLYNNPKNQKRMATYDPKAKQQKDRILRQQMQRIEFMLKKKKVTQKQIQQMKEYHYQNLMKEKLQRLMRYEELLIYNKRGLNLSLMEKEELIDIVFDALKQFDQRVKKTIVRDFMLANEKFSQVFHIGQEEVFNDLEVYQTTQQGFMTRNQLYQFIKSIQISNKMLNPSLNLKKTKKPTFGTDILSNSKNSKVPNSSLQPYSQQSRRKQQMKQYLKKLFQYLDQKNQALIQRQRFLLALKKGLLLNSRNNKSDDSKLVTKEYLEEFAKFLEDRRDSKQKKSYYKQLQGKFLGWTQVEDLYMKFMRRDREEESVNVMNNEQNLQLQEQPLQTQSQQQKKQQPHIQPITKGSIQQYFSQYGWQNPTQHRSYQQQQYSSSLKQFDQYYKQLRQKNGNQIEWNNNIRDKLSLSNNAQFAEDFGKLESYIKMFEKKNAEGLND